MLVYRVGIAAVGGLFLAAVWNNESGKNTAAKRCLIGAGIAGGLLFVYGLFDANRSVNIRIAKALEHSNRIANVSLVKAHGNVTRLSNAVSCVE
jgi:glutamate synthase domain-containing protein 3